ncbi:tyrosine-type recombinase/integrase [Brevibacterium sp. CSND-B09]|uniref:tyrosine-type recombinase/integrase n=1 Tax=Brevibacterium sp. CSND-B09 TaxID=3462571 RepID=UPI00406A4895
MASIHKTPSGKWQVRYRDGSGKIRAKTFKYKYKKAGTDEWAEKFKNEVEQSLTDGSYIAAERGAVDVPAWVQQHLDSRVDIGVTTKNRTQGIINTHIEPKWSTVRLSEVEHGDIAAWVKDLLETQSVRSVKKIVGVLSAAFEAAVRDRRVHNNPCKGIKYPKVTPQRRIYLSAEQVEQLAAATLDDRQKLIVYTLAYSGLRWGELAGLRVQDFDPLRRRLNVEQTIVDDNGKMLVKPPKTHEIRSVPVPKFLVEMIAAHIVGMDPDDLIFTSVRGEPLRNRNERGRWFDQAAKGIGIPDLTPHKLRNTAASMAISAGASVLSVQRMLGHESATVTLDVYAELFEDDLDEVAERLDSVRADVRVREMFVTPIREGESN